jgi:D-alanyl-lipoteichoic acid acyltransferase DltB (MBOAT superfamily)
MGFWGWLTGVRTAEKAMEIADKATGGLIAGVDAMFFTDEEKSRANFQITEAAIKMIAITQGEATVRSITRRVLAWLIMCTFLFLLLFGTMIFKVDPEWSAYCLNSAKALTFLATPVGIFYFGYYGVKAMTKD